MDDIFKQLGGLVLGSVPTIVFFIVLVVAYTLLVHRPLVRVLAERRARTTGAIDQARAAIAAAEAKTQDYENRLRAARAEIFHAREQRVKQWLADRDAALDAVRKDSQLKVANAKTEIEKSAAEAQIQIQTTAAQLATLVLKAVLPAGAAQAEGLR